MHNLHHEIPQELQNTIKNLNPAFWLKRACSKYRRCSSIHFGLGIPRNLLRANGTKYVFGKYTHILPELQAQLLSFIRAVAPDIQFSSIILNRFDPGDRMGQHIDGNIFDTQISIRFGDAVGAELCAGGQLVGNGCFLMNTNLPHEVSMCEQGVRYSIVTYIKKDACILTSWKMVHMLGCWGFPVQALAFLHIVTLLRFYATARRISSISFSGTLYNSSCECVLVWTSSPFLLQNASTPCFATSRCLLTVFPFTVNVRILPQLLSQRFV